MPSPDPPKVPGSACFTLPKYRIWRRSLAKNVLWHIVELSHTTATCFLALVIATFIRLLSPRNPTAPSVFDRTYSWIQEIIRLDMQTWKFSNCNLVFSENIVWWLIIWPEYCVQTWKSPALQLKYYRPAPIALTRSLFLRIWLPNSEFPPSPIPNMLSSYTKKHRH